MARLSYKQWLMFSTLLLLPLLFQNCGNGGFLNLQDLEMNESSSYDSFFNYPYSTKPDQFVNLHLVQSPGAPKYSSFVVFAAAADATGLGSVIPFQIRVADAAGTVLCPVQSGTFQPGQTSIQFSCTPSLQVTTLKIELSLSPSGGLARTIIYNFPSN